MAENSLNKKYEVLVIGGSAGSLEVILKILAHLHDPLSFSIVFVLHRKNSYDSSLTDLFASKTEIPVREIEEKESLQPGTIYIAPPDYHLLFEKNRTFSLDASEKVNFSRPSIDVTFESAADIFKSGSIAIILSGANADGTAGLKKIKQKGGTVIAQDPSSAKVSFMPQHAISHVETDFILNVDELISFINHINRSDSTLQTTRQTK